MTPELLIQFKKDVDARINDGDAKDEAILKELQKLITESKKIRFEGKINIKKNISELKKDDNEDINNRLMIGNNPYIIEITSLDNKKNYRIGYTFFENDMIEVDEYYRKESVIYFSNYDNLINYFMND